MVPPPEVQELYVPREDLTRTPGYDDSGLFLPLSRLRKLAREAQEPESAASPRKTFLSASIRLQGNLGAEGDGPLSLQGAEGASSDRCDA